MKCRPNADLADLRLGDRMIDLEIYVNTTAFKQVQQTNGIARA